MKTSTARKSPPTSTLSRTPEALLRRVPRQERGRERVDKLLDAAAAVIAEVGVDAATTNAIAARAQTSVGSLYQFFPNKLVIVEALAARYNDQLRKINEISLPLDAASMPLPELMERVITPLVEFHLENPAYRHVYHALHRPEQPEAPAASGESELHKAVVARIEAMLAIRAPQTPSDVRHLQATVAVLAVHGLLNFAVMASQTTRNGLVSELKRLMVVYLRDATTGRQWGGAPAWSELGRF